MGVGPQPKGNDRYGFDSIAAPALLLQCDVKTMRRRLQETSDE